MSSDYSHRRPQQWHDALKGLRLEQVGGNLDSAHHQTRRQQQRVTRMEAGHTEVADFPPPSNTRACRNFATSSTAFKEGGAVQLVKMIYSPCAGAEGSRPPHGSGARVKSPCFIRCPRTLCAVCSRLRQAADGRTSGFSRASSE